MNATKTDRKISERQRSYILSLLDQKDVPESAGKDSLIKSLRISEDPEEFGMSMAKASQVIDFLKGLPRKQREQSQPSGKEPEAGMYRQPSGEIVRVYLGQQSGRMLMKVLVEDSSSEHGFSYQYVGLAAKHLRNAKPLPLEEAKAFGRMTGTCCVCARRLDVPESVEAGIGPVCAKKFGRTIPND